jgi:hypothetical protein
MKYFFKTNGIYPLEDCTVINDGRKIGSIACQNCDNCLGSGIFDNDVIKDWIICKHLK